MTTYTIATDSRTATLTAATADEAAREFAASDGIRGVKTAEQLRAAIVRAGGYGTMQDEDGIIWTIGR